VQAAEEARLPAAQELADGLSITREGLIPALFSPLFSGGLNSSAAGGDV
jgi:hypothetical protein